MTECLTCGAGGPWRPGEDHAEWCREMQRVAGLDTPAFGRWAEARGLPKVR